MNSQIATPTDMQSAEAQYSDLVVRIRATIEGQDKDRQGLLSALQAIQKEMVRTLSKARRHAPSRKHREKYNAFVNSFALAYKILDQSFQSLVESPSALQYTPPTMPNETALDIWQEFCEDLADSAVDAERTRTKQRRDNINSVLDFLDALDRLLDDNAVEQDHFLDHLLEMFRLLRMRINSNLASIGLERIVSPVGTPLDPTYCEVVDSESRDGSESMVRKQLRAGYTLDGKVFRKAAVIVGSAE
jgi:molecular chaperone GrpE (heat shock protein)